MPNTNNQRDQWPKKELFLLEPKTLVVVILASALTLLVALFGGEGMRFLTSVLSPVPAHAPFDGTTNPIKKAPNWVLLSSEERKAVYSAIPENKFNALPTYDPTRLAIPAANLKWNNAEDDKIRNEKITYSVPYLGTYKLDGIEGAGSHAAVDIKVPEGTPIYAMANGTVIKADTSNGGFGHHVVIQHNDFPLLDDATQKKTIYSSYSHMSGVSVTFHQVVTKGQLIGYSGQTGTATTPHLHFQIDNDNPKWHPYWPFTTSDMKAAGYSFFQAINNGLGRENGRSNTINPMKYVQKYFDEVTRSAAPEPSASQPAPVTAPPTPAPAPVVVPPTPQPVPPPPAPKARVGGFFITVDRQNLVVSESAQVEIRIGDENANLITSSNFIFTEEPALLLTNNAGELTPGRLSENVFINGVAKIKFTARIPTSTEISVLYKGITFKTAPINIAPIPPDYVPVVEAAPVAAEAQSSEAPPPSETVTEQAPSVEPPFSDVAAGSTYFEALRYLKDKNLVAGYDDGTFKPDDSVTRAEAITFILRAINEPVQEEESSVFPDVNPPAWYVKYVATAYDLGFVKGYPSGEFGPDRNVSIEEFLTMLFVGAKVDVDPNITIQLPEDVAATDWFAPHVQLAIRKAVITIQNNRLQPGKALTRGEVAEMIYKFKKIEN